MTDRTLKALLFAIALGLWMHVAGDWFRPVPVQAQRASPVRHSVSGAICYTWGFDGLECFQR